MLSMSGFGRGSASDHKYRYHVECASVNRKGLEIVVALPRGLTSLEPKIREEIQKKFLRGRIQVSITEELLSGVHDTLPSIDMKAARLLLTEFKKVQKALHLPGEITIEMLLRAPGILKSHDPEPINVSLAWQSLQQALTKALEELLHMRVKEGKNLATDLKKRFLLLERYTKQIRGRVPKVLTYRRDQIQLRLADLHVTVEKNDPALLRELAFFAERSDISEELTRLESHLVQGREILVQSSAGGRALDYLAQEMFREFNTLSNKANDIEISRWVIQSKSELDKIREQVANLE